MKLIAGLGNPGKKYENTRHNIGFRATDSLIAKYNAKFKKRFFDNARQANILIAGQAVLVAQPLTYMNISGHSILMFSKKLKIEPGSILVICDDINLPIGKIRIRQSGSAGGHNGLSSIITSLGSEAFPRIRIGIGQQEPAKDLSEYVLSEFTREQNKAIETSISQAVCACVDWVQCPIEKVMSVYN